MATTCKRLHRHYPAAAHISSKSKLVKQGCQHMEPSPVAVIVSVEGL